MIFITYLSPIKPFIEVKFDSNSKLKRQILSFN